MLECSFQKPLKSIDKNQGHYYGKKKRCQGAGRLQGGRFKMSLTSEDKYVALKFENERLRRALHNVGTAFHEWRERALELEAERDILREDLQELAQARRET